MPQTITFDDTDANEEDALRESLQQAEAQAIQARDDVENWLPEIPQGGARLKARVRVTATGLLAGQTVFHSTLAGLDVGAEAASAVRGETDVILILRGLAGEASRVDVQAAVTDPRADVYEGHERRDDGADLEVRLHLVVGDGGPAEVSFDVVHYPNAEVT